MRVFRTILGMLLLTIGLPALLAGGGLWALMQHRDPGGAFSGQVRGQAVPGYALVVPDIDRLLREDAPFARVGATRLRLSAVTVAGPAFVGLAPARDVERYLAGVPHTRVDAVDIGTGALPLTTGRVPGRIAPAGMPGRHSFWTLAGQGQLSWTPGELTGGPYSLVVMDPAARPINKVASAAEVWPSWLNSSTWGLLTLGTLLVMASVIVLAWPGRRREVVYVVEPSQVPDLMQAIGAPLPLSGPLSGGRHGGAHRPRTLADSRPSRPPALPQFSWPPKRTDATMPELPPGGAATLTPAGDGAPGATADNVPGGGAAPASTSASAPTGVPAAVTTSTPVGASASAPAGASAATSASAPAGGAPVALAEAPAVDGPLTADGLPAGAVTPAPGKPLNLLGETPALAGLHPGPLPARRGERRRPPAPTDLPEFHATAVGAWVAATAPERARQTEARAAARLAEAAARKSASAAKTPPTQGGGRDGKPSALPVAAPRKRVAGEQRRNEATRTDPAAEPAPARVEDAATGRPAATGAGKPAAEAPGVESAKPTPAADGRTGEPVAETVGVESAKPTPAADGRTGKPVAETVGVESAKPNAQAEKSVAGKPPAETASVESAEPAEAAAATGQAGNGSAAEAGGAQAGKSEVASGSVSGLAETPTRKAAGQAETSAEKAAGRAETPTEKVGDQGETPVREVSDRAKSPVASEVGGQRAVAGERRPAPRPAGKQRGPQHEAGRDRRVRDGRPTPGGGVTEHRTASPGEVTSQTGARPSPRPQGLTEPSPVVTRIAMRTGPAVTDWTATGLTRLGTSRAGAARPSPQNPTAASARPAAPAAQPPAASPQPGAASEGSNAAAAQPAAERSAVPAAAGAKARAEDKRDEVEPVGASGATAVAAAAGAKARAADQAGKAVPVGASDAAASADGAGRPPVWPPVTSAETPSQDAVSAGEPASADKATTENPGSGAARHAAATVQVAKGTDPQGTAAAAPHVVVRAAESAAAKSAPPAEAPGSEPDGPGPAKPPAPKRPIVPFPTRPTGEGRASGDEQAADASLAQPGQPTDDQAAIPAAGSSPANPDREVPVQGDPAAKPDRASMHTVESGRPPAGKPGLHDADQPSDGSATPAAEGTAPPPRASMHAVETDGPAKSRGNSTGNGRKPAGRTGLDQLMSRAQGRTGDKRRVPAAWIKAAETVAARAAQAADEPAAPAGGPEVATPESLRAARGTVPRPKAPTADVPPRVTKEPRQSGAKAAGKAEKEPRGRTLSYREEAAELLAGSSERRRRRTVAGRPAEDDRPTGESES